MTQDTRSPWSSLEEARVAEIKPLSTAPNCELTIPGSKSGTNRALLLAGIANGNSRLEGILQSDDSYWCYDVLRRLGVSIAVEDGVAQIEGCAGRWPVSSGELYIGAAGTVARFLPGLLAGSSDGNWTIKASEQLSRRPITELVTALQKIGASLEYAEPGRAFPLFAAGGGLRGGDVEISGSISSQFVSGLLMAAPLAQTPTNVRISDKIVQSSYVKITLEMMRAFGADVQEDDALMNYRVLPGSYRGADLAIEADASTSTYFLALAAVSAGRVRIKNLNPGTLQPDIAFCDVLAQMGCEVDKTQDGVTVTGPAQLKGGMEFDMNPMSDASMSLAAVAPFADGPIGIRGVEHIRTHECDRVSVMSESLRRCGVSVEEHRDGWTIQPSQPNFGEIDSHDDHRIAMSMSIFGAGGAGVAVLHPGSVSKTCPNFFKLLALAGVESTIDATELRL